MSISFGSGSHTVTHFGARHTHKYTRPEALTVLKQMGITPYSGTAMVRGRQVTLPVDGDTMSKGDSYKLHLGHKEFQAEQAAARR